MSEIPRIAICNAFEEFEKEIYEALMRLKLQMAEICDLIVFQDTLMLPEKED